MEGCNACGRGLRRVCDCGAALDHLSLLLQDVGDTDAEHGADAGRTYRELARADEARGEGQGGRVRATVPSRRILELYERIRADERELRSIFRRLEGARARRPPWLPFWELAGEAEEKAGKAKRVVRYFGRALRSLPSNWRRARSTRVLWWNRVKAALELLPGLVCIGFGVIMEQEERNPSARSSGRPARRLPSTQERASPTRPLVPLPNSAET